MCVTAFKIWATVEFVCSFLLFISWLEITNHYLCIASDKIKKRSLKADGRGGSCPAPQILSEKGLGPETAFFWPLTTPDLEHGSHNYLTVRMSHEQGSSWEIDPTSMICIMLIGLYLKIRWLLLEGGTDDPSSITYSWSLDLTCSQVSTICSLPSISDSSPDTHKTPHAWNGINTYPRQDPSLPSKKNIPKGKTKKETRKKNSRETRTYATDLPLGNSHPHTYQHVFLPFWQSLALHPWHPSNLRQRLSPPPMNHRSSSSIALHNTLNLPRTPIHLR